MSTKVGIENLNYTAPPGVASLQRRALIIGALAGIATIIGFVVNSDQALRSWMIGFMLCVGLTLGSLAILMLWHMTGGAWGLPIRRILEAGSRNWWFLAVLFVPVLIGIKAIFPWMQPEKLESEHVKQLAHQYLNFKYFLLRAILYFVGWGALATTLNRWSALQDRPPERFLGRRLGALSAAGMVFYFWSMTFASVDWLMSMHPGWPSTIYAMIIVVGEALIALCWCVLLGHWLVRDEPMNVLMTSRFFHDMGKLLLTFVMLWAYLSFSQWLIIWAGNLPDEITWFMDRIHGHWELVALALVLLHFVVPFTLLLSRGLKQDHRRLVWVAALLFLMRYVDLYWNIEPNFHKENFHYSWLDAAVPIALVSFWIALFCWQLRRRPMAALHDPRLRAVFEEGGHE